MNFHRARAAQFIGVALFVVSVGFLLISVVLTTRDKVNLDQLEGLHTLYSSNPAARVYFTPPTHVINSPTGSGNPLSLWADVFQRITGELAADTAELANLDKHV